IVGRYSRAGGEEAEGAWTRGEGGEEGGEEGGMTGGEEEGEEEEEVEEAEVSTVSQGPGGRGRG
ncbi:unnamed protein product, partial [Closterium sp. NIES-64]